MKRFIVALMLMVGAVQAQADTFPFKTLADATRAAEQIGNDYCGTPENGAEIQVIVVKHEGTYYKLFVSDALWAAASSGADGMAMTLFFGTLAYGKLVLVKTETFDSLKHKGPCQDWLVPDEKGA
jgi:hypothetical protein